LDISSSSVGMAFGSRGVFALSADVCESYKTKKEQKSYLLY